MTLTSADSDVRARLYRLAERVQRSSLVGRALRGSAWSLAGYGVQTVLRFASRILLAKLLIDPVPLGTVAVVTTILLGLEMISDLGVNVNIVQHRDGAAARFVGTARTIQLLRAVALFLIAAALAWPVAWLYGDPELGPLLLFGALTVLIRGFDNPGMAVLVRKVELKRPALVGGLAEIAGFVVTVLWAVQAPSAWALVGGSVAAAATSAIASQFAGGRTPFAWDRAVAIQMVKFGVWIVVSTGTYFLSTRGEVLMLKGSIAPVEFGCFAFASMLVAAPLNAIGQLGSRVLLPMLADWVRAGAEIAQQQFRRVKWLCTGLASSFGWGAILLGPLLVGLLDLNPSYAPVGWIVQYLGVRAAFDIFAMPTSNTLLASGASGCSAFANTVRFIALVSGLFIALSVYRLGLEEAIWVLLGAQLLTYAALLPGLARHLRGVLHTELASFAVFCAAIVSAATLAALAGGSWDWRP